MLSRLANWSRPVVRIHKYAIALRASPAGGRPTHAGGEQQDHPSGGLRADVKCERSTFSRFGTVQARSGEPRQRPLSDCTPATFGAPNPSASAGNPVITAAVLYAFIARRNIQPPAGKAERGIRAAWF